MMTSNIIALFKHRLANRFLYIFVIISFGLADAIADWVSPYYLDHPLVGKIFSLEQNDWVSSQHVDEVVRNTKFLLLGETHTNPDHHLGQADLIGEWVNSQNKSAMVMEMLSIGEWEYDAKSWTSLADLQETVRKTAGKWNWEIYDPLLEVAVEHRLPIRAANLSKQKRAYFADKEKCSIEQDDKKFRFCDTITAAQKGAIEKLILDAHCGYLQARHVAPLVNTQIAKDASFALSLYRAGKEYNVVLIAGAVHVRKDIGVPRHLKRIGINSVSIAFIPVDPERITPAEYIDQHLGRPFDYIIFTPNERNVDPCVEFAEQLKKMKKH